MAQKRQVLGMSPAGGVATAGAVIAVIAAVLYGTSALTPQDDPADPQPVAAVPEPAPAPTSVAEPAPTPAPAAETAPAPETQAEAAPAVEPAPEDAAQSEPAPDAEAATEAAAMAPTPEAAALSAPRFDVVRAAPDGSVVVAGQAEAGSQVDVLVDGTAAETAEADGQGQFVAFLSLPPSTAPRLLTLRATRDGQTALSDEDIILAPTPAPAPVEVAAVPPTETQPDTETAEPATEAKTEAATEAPASEQPTEAPTDTAAAPVTAETPTETAAATPAPEPTPAPAPQAIAQAPTPAPSATAGAPAPQAAAPEAPVAVLRADAQGVELLQQATPDPDLVVSQIVLDTIGYGEDGAVLLSGRAAPGSPIRIYLDNQPSGDLIAGGDGRWRATLTDVAPGVYTLRLDAFDAAGRVASRIETPFKREAPAALAAAEAAASAQPPAPPIRQITVQTGDTLWAISRDRYGDGLLFVRVFEANRDAIRDPDLIYPGQVFTIPD